MNTTSHIAHATPELTTNGCGGRTRTRPALVQKSFEGAFDDATTDLDLDLSVFAAAMNRRLYAAGLPVTPERAVRFAQALILVGPLSRSRLYCTARTVFASDPEHLPAFDEVFASVFAGS